MSIAWPVLRGEGERSIIVILGAGLSLRRKKARTGPATPEPEIRMLRVLIVSFLWGGSSGGGLWFRKWERGHSGIMGKDLVTGYHVAKFNQIIGERDHGSL